MTTATKDGHDPEIQLFGHQICNMRQVNMPLKFSGEPELAKEVRL